MIDIRKTAIWLPIMVAVTGCGSDSNQLENIEITEQAYFAAMERMHKEIAPRYFAHVSGEIVDESASAVQTRGK